MVRDVVLKHDYLIIYLVISYKKKDKYTKKNTQKSEKIIITKFITS